jgi:hypothetical protein
MKAQYESLDKLDFDYRPPCEVRSGKEICHGKNPAEWRVVLAECCVLLTNLAESVVLMCDPCLTAKLSRKYINCIGCGRVFEPPSTAYDYFERI